MKKIFTMLVVLFIIYIGIQLGFRFFGKGHDYEYVITNQEKSFLIKEKFINNTKNEINNYYFEITINNTVFSYQTFRDFNKQDHIIENIIYYNDDEYECILPIFMDGDIVTDIMCLKNNIVYNYSEIKGTKSKLDVFAKSLSEYNYDENRWVDTEESSIVNDLTYYKNNLIDGHNLGLTTYKGIYTINDVNLSKPHEIELFSNDVYKKNISIIYNNYYVVADYDEKYRFTKFKVVDLTTNKTEVIDCEREISFDSYIQGVHNNSIYLFDCDNKKQYEVNLKTKKVLEVGNENTGVKIYKNDEWQKISVTEAKNQNILFESIYENDVNNKNYIRIDKVGGNNSGYYYYFEKSGNKYLVYRSNINNPNQLTYIFTTTDVNRIIYVDDYVYFIDNSILKCYHDSFNTKSILMEKELSFNENIIFGIYKK